MAPRAEPLEAILVFDGPTLLQSWMYVAEQRS